MSSGSQHRCEIQDICSVLTSKENYRLLSPLLLHLIRYFVYVDSCTLVPKTKGNSEYCDIGKKQDLGISLNPPVPTDVYHQSIPYIDLWGYHTNSYNIKGVAARQLFGHPSSYLSTRVAVSFWVNIKIKALKSHKNNNPTNLSGILKKNQIG